jgi:hypothetical protein
MFHIKHLYGPIKDTDKTYECPDEGLSWLDFLWLTREEWGFKSRTEIKRLMRQGGVRDYGVYNC